VRQAVGELRRYCVASVGCATPRKHTTENATTNPESDPALLS
jgi:hypothetical protein